MKHGLARITTLHQIGKLQLLSKVSTYHTPAIVYVNYMKALEAAALDEDVSKSEVVDLLNAKIKEITADNSTSTTDQVNSNTFINEFIDSHKHEYHFNSNWTMIEHVQEPCNRQITLDDISQIAINYNENVTHYKLTAESIKRAFFVAKEQKMMNGIVEVANSVSYDASSEKLLHQVLEFCYKWWDIKEDKDIFITLMKQWMWQVKRFLFNRKVRYHIWLNFTGASGLGKTEWIKLFCKPFEDVYSQTQVDVLLDSSREIKKFIDNYILNFDELAIHKGNTYSDTISVADMSIIKALLTADTFETRIMGGQNQMKAKRTFSVISSSNDHLYDTFYDPSTMRRYFEFECQVEHINDFTKLNKAMTFMTEAWKGIDENNDDGYFDPNSDVGKRITAIQSNYYPTKTTVHAWLEEKTPEDLERLAMLNSNAVYQDYKSWCEAEHCHSKTRSNFIDAAKHYGLKFDENAKSFSDMIVDENEIPSNLKSYISRPINASIDFDSNIEV